MRATVARVPSAPSHAGLEHSRSASGARQPAAVPTHILRRPTGGAARWRTHVLGPLRQLWGEKPAAEDSAEEATASSARVAALEAALPLQDAGADEALATTDTWAVPLPGDADDVAELRQLLAGTRLEAAPLVCAYDADRDGWSADAFHRRIDRRGPALVVALTGEAPVQLTIDLPAPTARPHGLPGDGLPPPRPASHLSPPFHCIPAAEGALLGGYNPAGWTGEGGDVVDSLAAFLFVWPSGDTTQRPIKLPKARAVQRCWEVEPSGGLRMRRRCGGIMPAGRVPAAGWPQFHPPSLPAAQVSGGERAVVRDAEGSGIFFGGQASAGPGRGLQCRERGPTLVYTALAPTACLLHPAHPCCRWMGWPSRWRRRQSASPSPSWERFTRADPTAGATCSPRGRLSRAAPAARSSFRCACTLRRMRRRHDAGCDSFQVCNAGAAPSPPPTDRFLCLDLYSLLPV